MVNAEIRLPVMKAKAIGNDESAYAKREEGRTC